MGDGGQTTEQVEQEVRWLGEMQRLRVAPGDVVVLRTDLVLSARAIQNLSDGMKRILPEGVRCLILEQGMEIGVLTLEATQYEPKVSQDEPKEVEWRESACSITCTCGEDGLFVSEGPKTCPECGRVWHLLSELVCTGGPVEVIESDEDGR